MSRWLDGEVATAEALADFRQTAIEPAQFLTALVSRPQPAGRFPARCPLLARQ
ncbi:hypothetical protein ACFWMG_33220 [Streptomyces sp. NPDC127074]|uniref:hypothetical protein n=1 Tax=Streptomyces sp. NPDC127074 TaxID=3347130 RepID=UPI00364B7949